MPRVKIIDGTRKNATPRPFKRPANAPTGAGAVFRTEVEPGTETVVAWKLGGQIGAEFTEDGLNAESIEAGDESQVDSKDTFQMSA